MNKRSSSIFDNIGYYLTEKYKIRFNEISLCYEFKPIESKEWQELSLEKLYVELERENLKFSFDKLIIYLKAIVEYFNPIIQYFRDLPEWDGYDYISDLLRKIHLNSDQEFFEMQFKKYLVRCVLCAIEEKKINKNAIIFYSRTQNIGKSTFIRYLCPEKLLPYFSENISADKDSQIKLATNFIINLDELQSFMTKDIEFVKALISKESINERLPYGKRSQRLIRRANFIGSTNRMDILRDHTNVRWMIFDVASIDFSYTEINIDKIWSQVYYLAYKQNDFNPFLTVDELNYNDDKNKRFRSFSREEEEILSYLEDSENEEDFMTSTEISFKLRHVFVNKNPVTLGKVLSNIGFKTKRIGSERTKKYMVKLTAYYFEFIRN
ncbi:VapE domain-containing protein [Chryseobacterium sp. 5_R23647]|uniref:VapE domain-containing protein n=1 Tax=Chryseobacterium sp. 5_R23647 TaxID=2258964 RepID=UPI000E251441|nr:VapE domain-containing protein [Chryseobacterium sp. 5_R23647]REC45176.1 virulence-associated E family protein [Chryseobacterium sp. 5_R23647]